MRICAEVYKIKYNEDGSETLTEKLGNNMGQGFYNYKTHEGFHRNQIMKITTLSCALKAGCMVRVYLVPKGKEYADYEAEGYQKRQYRTVYSDKGAK